MKSQRGPQGTAAGTRLLSDVRLARRAAAGDDHAFAAIYKRYQPTLYRFCLSIVGKPEDAQDALQNTMVKALRALRGEQRSIQLKPWLYRIAHNESVELLRRRRPEETVDPELATSAAELAETAALRERLRRLIADLGELPERQRAALVMRELGGLGFAQIGEAFDTSAAVARQTVYEARLGLRQLEAGREMECEAVMRQLSEADGRVTRRRDIRAHLRACPDCRAFRDSIATRRQDLTALAPLPLAASAGLLQAVLGGGQGGGTGTAAAAAVGAGAGKTVATATIVKSVATVAAVATIGVTAADRGGLVDAGLPGGNDAKERQAPAPGSTPDSASPPAPGQPGSDEASPRADGGDLPRRTSAPETGGSAGTAPSATERASAAPALTSPSSGHGQPGELPAASSHGQETAASHGGGRDSAGSRSHAPAAPKGPPPHAGPGTPKPVPPSHSQPPAPPSKAVGPDNSPGPPLQPSQAPKNQGVPKDVGSPPSKEAR